VTIGMTFFEGKMLATRGGWQQRGVPRFEAALNAPRLQG